MAVFVAWTAVDAVPADLAGPWVELLRAGPGLLLVDSADSLSRVYHELKWSLPDGTALLVAPITETPKLRGLTPGTTTWLRSRTSGGARRTP